MTPRPIPATNASGEVDHGPDEPGDQRQDEQVGAEHLGEDAGLARATSRMAVNADSTPASVQATVEVRRTQTPDRRAESAFSDMARMARPHGEYLMNAASAEGHERGDDEGQDLAGR